MHHWVTQMEEKAVVVQGEGCVQGKPGLHAAQLWPLYRSPIADGQRNTQVPHTLEAGCPSSRRQQM